MRKREEMRNMGKVGSADRNTRASGKGLGSEGVEVGVWGTLEINRSCSHLESLLKLRSRQLGGRR